MADKPKRAPIIMFNVTPEDKHLLEFIANYNRLPLATWIRSLVLTEARAHPAYKTYKAPDLTPRLDLTKQQSYESDAQYYYRMTGQKLPQPAEVTKPVEGGITPEIEAEIIRIATEGG